MAPDPKLQTDEDDEQLIADLKKQIEEEEQAID